MAEQLKPAHRAALDVAIEDLDAAAQPTKSEVFVACGAHAADLRDAIKAALALIPAVSAERPGREAWVLQRNNHPFAVYFDHAEGNAALAGKREAERQWYEENRHIADVRTYWNLYKADQGVAVPATPDA